MSDGRAPLGVGAALRAEGAAIEAIVAALEARGLERDDPDALLQEDPGYRALTRARVEARPTRSQRETPALPIGAWLRWAAIVLLALAAGSALGGGWWSIASFLAVPFFGLVAFELRHGLLVTARKLGFTLFFGFLPAALGGFIAGWRLPQLVGTALFLTSFALLWRSTRVGEVLRHVDFYGAGTTFESNGVQFQASHDDRPLAPGEFLCVRVVAQNVLTAPRRFEVALAGDPRSGLTEPMRLEAELPPGQLVGFLLPLQIPRVAIEWFNLTLGVRAIGVETGRRLRVIEGAR